LGGDRVIALRTVGDTLTDTVIASLGGELCKSVLVAWEQPDGTLRISLLPPTGSDEESYADFLARLLDALLNPDDRVKEIVDLSGPGHSRAMTRAERRRFNRSSQNTKG